MAKNNNKTKINTYWQNRAEKTFLKGEKDALKVAKDLQSTYKSCVKEINTKINAFYGKYAVETGLTLEEATELLDRNELKDFKSYINKMLSMGDKEDFSIEQMAEFRRLYNKAKITRLEELQANIEVELDKLAALTVDNIADLLANSYENGYYETIYNVQMELNTNNAFSGLDKNSINKAISQKYLRSNFRARIWENNSRILKKLVQQDIPRGIVLGYNPKKLASDVVNKRIDRELYNATVRLIRTEYSHILNQATLDGYKQCRIDDYKILTTLDDRRCDDCKEFEGKVINIAEAIEGVNMPPFHPNCRCTTIPYFEKDEIDEMTIEELDKIGFVTYADWKNGLVTLKDNKVIYKERSED